MHPHHRARSGAPVAWLFAAVFLTFAQAPVTDPALADLDKHLQAAVVKGQSDLVERHYSADFAFTHYGGDTDSKAKWVALAKQDPKPYLARDVRDQVTEVHGDVGIVTGRLDVRVPARPPQGPLCYALRYVHVYAKRDGVWMFLSHRTSQMIEESHPCR
jgi:hypothetical protein